MEMQLSFILAKVCFGCMAIFSSSASLRYFVVDALFIVYLMRCIVRNAISIDPQGDDLLTKKNLNTNSELINCEHVI